MVYQLLCGQDHMIPPTPELFQGLLPVNDKFMVYANSFGHYLDDVILTKKDV